ncbi:MAG: hypothetical protein AAF518_12305 [Spirochaetota bacterium]
MRSNLKKLVQIVLLLCLCSSYTGAQDASDTDKQQIALTPPINKVDVIAPIKDLGFRIEYFDVRDLSKEQYWVSISCPDTKKVIRQLNGKKDKNGKPLANPYRIQIGKIGTDVLRGTAHVDPDNSKMVIFQVIAYYPIKSQEINEIKLFYQDNGKEYEIAKYSFSIVNTDDKPNQQPLVLKLDPNGGEEGSTITVNGKNFGEDIDNIIVEFVESESFQNPDGITIERYISEIKPFFLSSTDAEKNQTIRFSIPIGKNLLQDSYEDPSYNKKVIFRNPVKMRVIVRGRPSDYITFSVLPGTWKVKTLLLSILVVTILLGSISIMTKKLNYVPLILMEPATNTYSLSKFQALAWTITLLGSYFYLAIAHGLLLRNGQIPDFNPSLLVLMSISYGGLLTAGSIGTKKSKNEPSETPPEFKNLFMEGGVISLPRLQLFGFTVVGILIYIYTLYTSNLLQGLPDVPPTLLGLLGVSQGGYLGGKAMGDPTHINLVSPRKIPLGMTEKITLVGSGFQPDTRILFEGFEPIHSEFINPNSISFHPPNFTLLGGKQMTLIPPSGAPSVFPNVISAVESDELEHLEGDYTEIVAKEDAAGASPALEEQTPVGESSTEAVGSNIETDTNTTGTNAATTDKKA